MPLIASPFCQPNYQLSAGQCCRNYNNGVSCTNSPLPCGTFNFTSMTCDNGNQAPGEHNNGVAVATLGTDVFIVGFGSGCTNTSPCSRVITNTSFYPGVFLSCFWELDMLTRCIDGDPLFAPSGFTITGGLSGNSYSVSGASKRCLDAGGGAIDCVREYWLGGSSYTLGPNEDARWYWSKEWGAVGCYKLYRDWWYINGLNNPKGKCFASPTVGGTAPLVQAARGVAEYLGCPSPFVSRSGAKGNYSGSGGAFSASPGNYAEYATVPTSGTNGVPADTGLIPWAEDIGFSQSAPYLEGAVWKTDSFLSGTALNVPGCYQADEQACPNDSNGAGTSGPCTYPCVGVSCAAGYTYNPSTSLCEKYIYNGLSFCRARLDGRLLVATVETDGDLVVLRYSDALTDTVEETVTVEASSLNDITHPVIKVWRDGSVILMYRKGTSAYFRRSTDLGKTWGSATLIGTATAVQYYVDERDGMLVVMLYTEPSSGAGTWKTSIGSLSADGTTWSFATPTTLTSNVYRATQVSADVQRWADGSFDFAYVEFSTNQIKILRCSNLKSDGTGTSTVVANAGTGFGVTYWLDPRDGMLVLGIFNSGGGWSVKVGTLSANGSTWSFSSAQTVTATSANHPSADIHRRADGVWEFAYINTSNAVQIKRCKNLSTTGTGTWA